MFEMSDEFQPKLRLVQTPLEERSPIKSESRARNGPRPCLHHTLVVNARERRVRCESCDAELDPYEALHILARAADRYDWVLTKGHNAARVEQRRRDELAREERNAKARLASARRRALAIDGDAIHAAARAAKQEARLLDGYREWDDLSEPQRDAVRGYVRLIVEAYAGALEARTSVLVESATSGEAA